MKTKRNSLRSTLPHLNDRTVEEGILPPGLPRRLRRTALSLIDTEAPAGRSAPNGLRHARLWVQTAAAGASPGGLRGNRVRIVPTTLTRVLFNISICKFGIYHNYRHRQWTAKNFLKINKKIFPLQVNSKFCPRMVNFFLHSSIVQYK